MSRIIEALMRRHIFALPLIAAVSLASAEASAEYLDTTGSLRAGQLTIAGGLQADVAESTPLLLNLHEGIGLASGVDLVLRQGLGIDDQPLYLGAELKWSLLGASVRRGRPGIAVWAGGHTRLDGGASGVDGMIAFDYPIGRALPYAGLDANLEFFNSNVELFMALLLGVRIGLARNIGWFVEGGIGLKGEEHFISTGPRMYL